jgi:hypothetical protein
MFSLKSNTVIVLHSSEINREIYSVKFWSGRFFQVLLKPKVVRTGNLVQYPRLEGSEAKIGE